MSEAQPWHVFSGNLVMCDRACRQGAMSEAAGGDRHFVSRGDVSSRRALGIRP